MRKFFFLLSLAICAFLPGFSQNIGMGTGSPDPSAILDITGTGKGILLPRMTSTNIAAIASPAKGLMVYDSLKNQLLVNMGSPAVPDWQNIGANSGWGLTGNSGTNPLVNFIGTTDSVPLLFRINNNWAGSIDSTYENTAIGYASNRMNKAGTYNTLFGYQAMDSVVSANYNTVFGAEAFRFHSPYIAGSQSNTVAGYQAFASGGYNFGMSTATGYQAVFQPSDENTATGYQAGFNGEGELTSTGSQAHRNGNGGDCTATGAQAMYNNTIPAQGALGGAYSTASGYAALFNNLSGQANTAGGYQSLYKNLDGSYNTAYGNAALFSNNSNSQNTAAGSLSLLTTTSSDGNTAIGYNAGHTYNNGYYNCFIGAETDATGPGYYNSIALGHGTLVTGSNMMRVGNGATTSIGGPVGWSTISDGRVKKNVQENVPGLAFINKLRPVSYNIDVTALQAITQPAVVSTGVDAVSKLPAPRAKQPVPTAIASALRAKEQIVYTGFVAQEVELAAQSLNYAFSGVDAPKNDKDLYSLRYAEFVMPLVKAVQELATQQALLKKENTRLLKDQQQVLTDLHALEQAAHK